MFTEVGIDLTPCSKGHNYINFNGEMVPPHEMLQNWDLNDYVNE